jgi:hypothetical protein
MATAPATTIISHWDHMVPCMQQSSAEFYSAVDQCLKEHHLSDANTERVNIREGGLLSAKREYLQVRRKDHVFHICAAPFGNGFFVSWWLGEVQTGLMAMLAGLPFVGRVFAILTILTKPLTYYRVDTALMFQSITHGAVLSALESVIEAKGARALTEIDKKPIMRDFFGTLPGGGV